MLPKFPFIGFLLPSLWGLRFLSLPFSSWSHARLPLVHGRGIGRWPIVRRRHVPVGHADSAVAFSMGIRWELHEAYHRETMDWLKGKSWKIYEPMVFGSSNSWTNMVVVLHGFPWTHPVIRVDQTSCLISCQMDIPYDWSHHRLIIHAKSWVKSHLRCWPLKA